MILTPGSLRWRGRGRGAPKGKLREAVAAGTIEQGFFVLPGPKNE